MEHTINPLSDAGKILQYIKNNEGCTPKDAINFFENDIERSGISTTFSNLYYEGCVRREKIGNTFRYWFITDKKRRTGKRPYHPRTIAPKAEVQAPAAPATGNGGVLLLVPVGDNQTATLTIEQAKALSDTLSAVFR